MQNKEIEENVILTPIYKGLAYKYHECSNCKGEIYFEEDICNPFHFEEKIKYCPYCGNKVIGYAKPKYIEAPNWDWLEEFEEVINKTYRFLEYKIHCKMSREQIRELIDKAEFGEAYFGKDFYPVGNGNICNLIHYIAIQKLHYSTINKLKSEFERGTK